MGKYKFVSADQQNLSDRVEFTTLDVFCYLCNDGKQYYIKNANMPVKLMNVFHIDGSIIEDTKEGL